MRSVLRQFRRAPGRIVASVLALALAIGAIGVLAIPTISKGSLREAVARDGLADVIATTTAIDDDTVAAIASLANVSAAEGEADAAARLGDGTDVRLIGLDFADHTMDRVQLTAGRLPEAPDEVVVSPGLGAVGDVVVADGQALDVVGVGQTLWWADVDALYAPFDTVAERTGGANRVVVTADDDGERELRDLADQIRDTLAADGATYTTFPVMLADGSTPIDADIQQVSTLIGLLGVFAGLIALVLLAGTTNTLITERTREVAVMRALGGRSRALRRRLRRIATGITAAALVVGLPLGVFISNLIARMVLEKFVGLTPDLAIDWRVLAGSAVAALVGARVVSARAARRVVRQPLAEALRDRDGAPFGGRWYHRLAARLPLGGLRSRMAARAALRRPARTVAVVTQIAAAVGAAFLSPTLIRSVNDYNAAAAAPFSWGAQAFARDAGLPIQADEVATHVDDPTAEAVVWTFGEIDDWEVEIFGLEPDSAFFHSDLRDGRWFDVGEHGVLMSAGFAARRGYDVGEEIDVVLASGTASYTIVGTVEDHGRGIYLDRDVVASDLGSPGMSNTIWTAQEDPDITLDQPIGVDTATEVAAANNAGRDAIVMIFASIGAIVAGVAALAVLSTMTVNLFERRHELAAMQAIGARRSRVRGVLIRELLPLGLAGVVLGVPLGAVGARGIIASFEHSNAVDIGVTDAVGALPFVVVGTAVALVALAAYVARSAGRRPIAVTLRGAA